MNKRFVKRRYGTHSHIVRNREVREEATYVADGTMGAGEGGENYLRMVIYYCFNNSNSISYIH